MGTDGADFGLTNRRAHGKCVQHGPCNLMKKLMSDVFKVFVAKYKAFYSVELLLYSALYYRDQIDFVESESSLKKNLNLVPRGASP